MSDSTKQDWEIEVFYDGDCPLCRREIAMLQRWDRHGRIRATNIAEPGFQAESLGLTQEALMAEIHGRLRDGTLVSGVEVFRRLYSAVGFRWLVAPTRLPGIRWLMDVGYRLFARNRLRLTGRCEAGACTINHRHASAGNSAAESDPAKPST